MSTPISTKQQEMLDRISNIMQAAVVDHDKGFHGKAIKNLQAGLNALTNTINKIKKEDVPVELYNMQAKMATELSKWKYLVKEGVAQSKTGADERKVKQEALFKNSTAKKVVGEFVSALDAHKGDVSLALLVKELNNSSRKFKNGDISFKEYKESCLTAVDAHKKQNHKAYYQQPHGIFQHITNALRAMMRVLEKMFNAVTGYKSNMFKKADSNLGKEVKEFHAALEALKTDEPKAQNTPSPVKAA